MLKRRKLIWKDYVVLVILFAIAIWLNFRLYYVNSSQCYSSTTGICSGVISYRLSEFLAYFSIVILAIHALYLYLIREEIKEKQAVDNNTEGKVDEGQKETNQTNIGKERPRAYYRHRQRMR